ncbi:MAG: trypsin-like peptidase domain-containing protein [bacterium]|nr:trypsin-like peptidase domain-containing protein [bacterium]
MENIRNIKNLKNVLPYFLTSLLSVVLVLAILSVFAWHKKAEIFGYFASEYLKEQRAKVVAGVDEKANEDTLTKKLTEKIIEPISQKEPTVLNQESMVVDVVKKTNPAVVSIVISKEVPKYETYVNPNQERDPFGGMFPGFNFNVPQYRQNGMEKKEVGGGSGFFVTSNGLIVTNKHVVDQKDVEYTVYTNDGKKYTATVVARDPVLDIALIKVTGFGFPFLSLGNSDSLQVGHTVIAIGNALSEFRNTVSVGVVSGLSRSITAGDNTGKTELLDHVIQTDAAINPGNSGGPLLNLKGEVIGVNVAVAQGSQSIGFALPINTVRGAIDSVKSTGKIVRPYLGVRYVAINATMKEKNNLSVDYGVLVKAGATPADLAVIPGSPADKAGIVENDIILEIAGVKLDEGNNLASIIRQKKVGDVVMLKILSKGVQKTVYVTLEVAKDN